ncbi:MAG: acyltransferase [Acidaminococcales bacterium]|jgi:peptidoglycan/LPS O-acetylase OafA/YrhL|nr:acyltransferase [Acidaminococcales bacterium]
MQQNDIERIPSLTSLRFFAAGAVFAHHFDAFLDLDIPGFAALMRYPLEGSIGVAFFYILSGFVIAYSYQDRLAAKTITPVTFLFCRWAKLWPVHIITLLSALFIYKNFTVRPQLPANFFLLQSLVPYLEYFFSYNGVSWSISVEMFFYAAFCFLAFLSGKRIAQIFSGLLFIIIVFGFWLGAEFWGGYLSWLLYINPFFRIIDFLAGIMLCNIRRAQVFHLAGKAATCWELLSVFILAVFVLFGVRFNVNGYLRGDLYYLLPMCLLIFIFSLNKGVLSRLLSHPALIFLGESSFCLYMVHQLVLNQLKISFAAQLHTVRDMLVLAAFAAIAAVSLAALLHVFYEKPLHAYLKKLWTEKWRAQIKNYI